PFTISGEPDVTTSFCVLGGVVQQIHEDLSEPDGIGVEIERLWRQANGEFLTTLVDEGTAAFHSAFQNRRQHNTLFTDVQLVAANARHVEKVVYEPHHYRHLPGDDISASLHVPFSQAVHAEVLQGVADRGQRVS